MGLAERTAAGPQRRVLGRLERAQVQDEIAAMTATAVFHQCPSPALSRANKDVGGAFQIQNAKTHKCLTIAGGTSPQNNLEAVQFDYDSDVSRSWRLDQLAE